MLKAAVEGKLTKKWREENKDSLEPADRLLERILEERRERWEEEYRKKYKDKGKELPKGWKNRYSEPAVPDISGLPNQPPEWNWVNLKQIGKIVTGTTPKTSEEKYYGNEFPFYKPTDLNSGFYTRDARNHLSEAGIKEARLLPEKTISVTCIGATIGKSGYLRKAGATNQQINSIVPSSMLNSKLLYFFIISGFVQNQIKKKASSTTLPIINKTKFSSITIPLPPLKEQNKVVDIIEKVSSLIKINIDQIDKELKRASNLKSSILKKAFTGNLVHQNPKEEPASELLKRINEANEEVEEQIAIEL